MAGHLEPLAAVVRVGGAYGAPYTWAATVRYLSPTEIEIVGATRAPAPSEWRALRTVLRAHGVRTVRFDRHRGAVERHQIDI